MRVFVCERACLCGRVRVFVCVRVKVIYIYIYRIPITRLIRMKEHNNYFKSSNYSLLCTYQYIYIYNIYIYIYIYIYI